MSDTAIIDTGQHRVVEVMGTVFSVDIRAGALAPNALAAIVDWWQWVDATFSTYRPDSAISELARGSRRVDECPEAVADVLALCVEATGRTGGFFTACPGGRLDPSGLVKGWSIEVASRRLTAAGSTAHCINGGGDVRLVGESAPGTPWHVGIADPNGRDILTVVTGADLAVATSGSAERGAHIVNPFTDRPARDPVSVTVVGPDLTWADAYATAAVAMGAAARPWLDCVEGYEGIGVTASGDIWTTRGWSRHAV